MCRIPVLIAVIFLFFGFPGYAQQRGFRAHVQEDAIKTCDPSDSVMSPETGPKMVGTMGAMVLPAHIRMIDLGTGFTSAVFVRYHIPVRKNIELAPFFTVDYGWDTNIDIGDLAGLQLKFNLYSSPRFDLALIFAPGARVGYYHSGGLFDAYDGIDINVQAGFPVVMVTFPVMPDIMLNAGLKAPISVFVYPYRVVDIPILFNIGMEYNVLRNINFFFALDMGPDICVEAPHKIEALGVKLKTPAYTTNYFRAMVLLGMTYRL